MRNGIVDAARVFTGGLTLCFHYLMMFVQFFLHPTESHFRQSQHNGSFNNNSNNFAGAASNTNSAAAGGAIVTNNNGEAGRGASSRQLLGPSGAPYATLANGGNKVKDWIRTRFHCAKSSRSFGRSIGLLLSSFTRHFRNAF